MNYTFNQDNHFLPLRKYSLPTSERDSPSEQSLFSPIKHSFTTWLVRNRPVALFPGDVASIVEGDAESRLAATAGAIIEILKIGRCTLRYKGSVEVAPGADDSLSQPDARPGLRREGWLI